MTNVAPMRQKGELGTKAAAFHASFVHCSEMKVRLDRDYLVKGWLDRATVSLLYGPSGTGKTFLCLNMANAIANGTMWHGHRVKQANVMMVALEGRGYIANRMSALDSANIHVSRLGMKLDNPTQDATFFSEGLMRLGEEKGPFGLVIIDTLRRATSGEENSSGDMSRVIDSVERIRAMTGCHCLLVHHSGKDGDKGARGSNAIPAAVDTEIRLTKEDDIITATATKQRDMEDGKTFSFRLATVELGKDSDGDTVTTRRVEPAERPAKGVRVTGKAEVALQALDDTLAKSGQRRTSADNTYLSAPCVSLVEWADMADRHGLSASEDPKSRAREFRRQREKLHSLGLIRIIDEYVWRVAP